MGGEQMAGMRPKRLGRPPHGLGASEHGAVFTHAVRQRDVHLQAVLVRAQTAVAQQVGGVVEREQVFAGGDGAAVALAKDGQGGVIERRGGLFHPGQAMFGQHRQHIGVTGLPLAVQVHRQVRCRQARAQGAGDALGIELGVTPAEFDLDRGVAPSQALSDFVAQRLRVGVVGEVAAGGVSGDACRT